MRTPLSLIFIVLCSLHLLAQNAGTEVSDFNYDYYSRFGSGLGSDTYFINTLEILPDGKTLVGGSFSSYNGTAASGLFRLNPDGGIDPTFHIGIVDDDINAISIQADGKILIGGTFTSFDGIAAHAFTRLNADGTKDITFTSSGIGPDDEINDIEILPNGKILVAGNFDYFNSVNKVNLVQLLTNGQVDNSFTAPTFLGDNYSEIDVIELHPDGGILVGGDFSGGIIKLTSVGGFDTNSQFQTVGSWEYDVKTIEIDPNNKVLIAGYFTQYGTASVPSIVRTDLNGILDITFNPGELTNGGIKTTKTYPDGKILIGGSLFTENNINYSGIVRLNENGSFDTTFIANGKTNEIVNVIRTFSNGDFFIGGGFTLALDHRKGGVFRMTPEGALDVNFGPATGANSSQNLLQASLHTSAIHQVNKILVGGSFTEYNGIRKTGLIRLNEDGTLDNSFNTNLGQNSRVFALAVQADEKILVSGLFIQPDSSYSYTMIRLEADGSLDPTFVAGFPPKGISSIDILASGKILVGGDHLSNSKAVLRLMPNGALDPTFNTFSPNNNSVFKAIELSTGKIFVASTNSWLFRLNANGTEDATYFAPFFAGSTGYVGAELTSDQKIIIAGPPVTNYVARLNTNGSIDTSFHCDYLGNFNSTQPEGLLLLTDGKFIVSGNNLIKRFLPNGDLDPTFSTVTLTGHNGNAFNFIELEDKLIAMGNFSTVNGAPRNNIVGLGLNSSTAEINNDNLFSNNGWFVFPNPVESNLTINKLLPIDPNNYSFEVIRLDGTRMPIAPIIEEHSISVNMNEFEDGLYFLHITSKTDRTEDIIRIIKLNGSY